MGYIMTGIEDDWNISKTLSGLVSSCFIVGLFIGAYLWGILGDRKGRMASFKRTVFFAFISSTYLVFSMNYPMMMVGMLFLGIGIGGEIAVGGTCLLYTSDAADE